MRINYTLQVPSTLTHFCLKTGIHFDAFSPKRKQSKRLMKMAIFENVSFKEELRFQHGQVNSRRFENPVAFGQVKKVSIFK